MHGADRRFDTHDPETEHLYAGEGWTSLTPRDKASLASGSRPTPLLQASATTTESAITVTKGERKPPSGVTAGEAVAEGVVAHHHHRQRYLTGMQDRQRKNHQRT